MRYAALIVVPLAAAQILVEGARWQMYPDYALSGLLSIVWLSGSFSLSGGMVGRWLTNPLGIRLFGGLVVLGLAASIALGSLLPVFHFPRPSGPYHIGTVTYHWVDAKRHEIFSSDPSAHRELMVQVWYPSTRPSSARRAPYVTDAGALSASLARQLRLPSFVFDYWKDVATNAVLSAPIATDKSSYPVLVFLTGVDGYRQSNTSQVEELASHGYIVVGLDQPYAAAAVVFPDGRVVTGSRDFLQPFINQSLSPSAHAPLVNGQPLPNGVIPYLAQDVSFTLDQLGRLNQSDPKRILTGHLDLKRVGVFGVSLGAMIAGQACHADTRLRACLMMDAAMVPDVAQSGLAQPSMWLTRDAASMRLEGWSESAIDQTLETMRATFARSQPGQRYYVEIPGMFHLNFTDAPYFSPLAQKMRLTGPINGQRGLHIVNAYTLAFFDRFLDDQSEALLDGPSKQFPDVRCICANQSHAERWDGH